MVYHADELTNDYFSCFLGEKLQQDYHEMAEIFSKTIRFTSGHCILYGRIEQITKRIIPNEINLTEIYYKNHYTSLASLS